MVASALQESSEQKPAKFTILQESNVQEYLKAAKYPPFAHVFTSDKTEKELENARRKIILSLKEKSPIQRTAIAYVFSTDFEEEVIEQDIFYKTRLAKLKYANIFDLETHATMAVVLSTSFCLELYQETSSLKEQPPSEHSWMFGYSQSKASLKALMIGRPISIASPLFRIPYVHHFKTGKQLGITVHDLTYHLTLDWQNPHSRLFIQLGQSVLNMPNQSKKTKTMAIELLDREAVAYPNSFNQKSDTTPLQDFWISLMNLIATEDTSDSNFYNEFSLILKNTLPSEFLDPLLIKSTIIYYRNTTITRLSTYIFTIDFLKNLIANTDLT